MSVRLRLRRMGRKKKPFYRIVAADQRSPRDGRFIEIIGHYDPLQSPHKLELKEDRVYYWLGQGAQPSTTVKKLLRGRGIWHRLELQKMGLEQEKIDEEMKKWELLQIERQKRQEAVKLEKTKKKAAKKEAEKEEKAAAEEAKVDLPTTDTSEVQEEVADSSLEEEIETSEPVDAEVVEEEKSSEKTDAEEKPEDAAKEAEKEEEVEKVEEEVKSETAEDQKKEEPLKVESDTSNSDEKTETADDAVEAEKKEEK